MLRRNWMELAATIGDWAIQDCAKDNSLWKSVDAENLTKNTFHSTRSSISCNPMS
jgi:hypothetical protein